MQITFNLERSLLALYQTCYLYVLSYVMIYAQWITEYGHMVLNVDEYILLEQKSAHKTSGNNILSPYLGT